MSLMDESTLLFKNTEKAYMDKVNKCVHLYTGVRVIVDKVAVCLRHSICTRTFSITVMIGYGKEVLLCRIFARYIHA